MWNAREDGVAVINAGCNIDVYNYFNTLTLTEGGAQACDGKKGSARHTVGEGNIFRYLHDGSLCAVLWSKSRLK